ncbi:unnamed protein product, partial [marine sediment metagenome]
MAGETADFYAGVKIFFFVIFVIGMFTFGDQINKSFEDYGCIEYEWTLLE